MNRWKMHKLGFLNFWLYDQEEFPVQDGHILLRGNNASGKSITTQSFIPFLLDGDKRPERLDAFGTRERKMEFYLLGDGEREESTGYLYLEFKRRETEEYLTLGIGLRAQRGKPMDFWGFCLCDGRRIGPDGLRLYERVGKQLIPLSRQKLKNLLNDDENFADSPSAYKKLVNERVFRFRDIEQYNQLLQLLIKVRMPKLSKDAFRPSELKKILNESLQVLTDEDLSAMVSTMERMDDLEEQLRSLQDAMRDARTIRNEYTRYNQYMLGMKGHLYLKARAKAAQAKNRFSDAQAELEHLEQEQKEHEEKRDRANSLLQQAMAQRAVIGEDDLSAQRARLEDERNNQDGLSGQLAQGNSRLERLREDISDRELALREKKRELEDAEAEIQTSLRNLKEENILLSLGDEHEELVRRVTAGDAEFRYQPARRALQRRKEEIAGMLSCLAELAKANEVYDAACKNLDLANEEAIHAGELLRDAQQQEQQERDALLERMLRRLEDNEELHLSPDGILSLKRLLSQYHSPAGWTAVGNLLDGCCREKMLQLTDEKNRSEIQLEALLQERDGLSAELSALQSRPEPAPPRREQIQATRIQLLMRGIPYAAFYEAVDFSPELSQEERDLVEAQLSDAGLLDALVVSEADMPQIQELLQLYPDRFVQPGAPVEDPLQGLIPDGDPRFRETVLACLQGISRSDWEADTALLPDGRFRCGMIRGWSQAEGPAGFVGAAARRANRERQIQELTARLEQAEQRVRETRAKADALALRLEVLARERGELPTAEDLDYALEMLEQAHSASAEAEKKQETCLNAERSAKQAAARIEQKSRETGRGLPYERSREAYEEARDSAESYGELLSELEIQQNRWASGLQTLQSLQEHLDALYDQTSEKKAENDRLQKNMEIAQARIQEIQAFLDRPENRARAQRITELEEEIQRQREIGQEAETQCAVLQSQRSHAEETLQTRKEELQEAARNEADAEQYFLEDLHLGFFPALQGDPEPCAQQAWAKVRPEDRERASERVGEALRNNYQQHMNTLLRYQVRMNLIFDDARPGMLRQRLCIILQKDGKEFSLYDFIQKLQADIDTTAMVLEEKDRDLFENILTETISHKLRARIEESQQWAADMTALMGTLKTSMGLTFRLDWKAKRAEGETELDTAQLVLLLNKDRSLVTREDSQRVSTHFRTKVKKAREEAKLEGQPVSYADLIRGALDYRNWYEFHLLYERDGEARKELTDRAFHKFSGGEKAMAMYVPLFAAVSAQYRKGGPGCPMLLALDEAFAGVDDRNISAMFELVETLDFDYIMNSQALWGCYPCVKSLDIAELHRPANAGIVTILRYHWNGSQRAGQEDIP